MTTNAGIFLGKGSKRGYEHLAAASPALAVSYQDNGALDQAKTTGNGNTITVYRDGRVFGGDAPGDFGDWESVEFARQAAGYWWPLLREAYLDASDRAELVRPDGRGGDGGGGGRAGAEPGRFPDRVPGRHRRRVHGHRRAYRRDEYQQAVAGIRS